MVIRFPLDADVFPLIHDLSGLVAYRDLRLCFMLDRPKLPAESESRQDFRPPAFQIIR